MKNVRQDFDDLRPEYQRSDFGEMVKGKHALVDLALAEFVRLLIACIGEDEGLTFTKHLAGNSPAGRKPGDWTYEIDAADRITLRYWLDDLNSIDEPISNPSDVYTPQQRAVLQNLLEKHVRNLKNRVAAGS
ncbi:MAG TPA: hypothetical protein VJT15_22690 [Pyrinomonadaceae bacterium]|nr:hypothetical protein [Pyrinomonadaceae bacterium]